MITLLISSLSSTVLISKMNLLRFDIFCLEIFFFRLLKLGNLRNIYGFGAIYKVIVLTKYL